MPRKTTSARKDWVIRAKPIEGIERIEAWFQGKAYAMHRHDTYAIGRTIAGVQTQKERIMSTLPGADPAGRGQCRAIDLAGKLELINDRWQPRVIAEMNDYQFKVVKVEGEFVWHEHSATDETFIVLDGELHIDFRGETTGEGTITLRSGQMAVIPKGVEHKPIAIGEVKLMLIEPRGVVNTGDGETGEHTAQNDTWI